MLERSHGDCTVANLTILGNQFRGFFCPPLNRAGVCAYYMFGEIGSQRRMTLLDFYGTSFYEDHR
jgi:hypothetical protein